MFIEAPDWGLHQGLQVPGDVGVSLLRSSAARAALPGQGLGAPPIPTFVSGQLCLGHYLVRSVCSLQICGGATTFPAIREEPFFTVATSR